jgi:hypothetical protein
MAKGYPSRHRAQKAFWRGVRVATTGRGINPYRNPFLKKLFERGKLNPGATPPAKFAPKPKPARAIRSSDRSARASGGRYSSYGSGQSGSGLGGGQSSSNPFGRPLRYGQGSTPPPPQRRPRPEGW